MNDFFFNKKPYSSIPDERAISFDVVNQPLTQILRLTNTCIEREWPSGYNQILGMKELFCINLKVAENTFNTILYFCAEKPVDRLRKLEFGLSSIPLLRSLLDQVFNLTFISTDPQEKVPQYYYGGWKELREHYLRCKLKYDTHADWIEWLEQCEAGLEKRKQCGKCQTHIVMIKSMDHTGQYQIK
ncbi:hypothetical protein JXA32_14810 [Candidatus Sumerlaeota bacterium]|nr:hypothetical protein [Candidatus Sumerlaeota bacterium]